MTMILPERVIIKGGGDLATGTAHRLHMAGLKVAILELPQPLTVRTTVAFASAVYQDEIVVEGVRARLIREEEDLEANWKKDFIPVFKDPSWKLVSRLRPHVLVDAIIAKRNTGTYCADAPIVIGLGPGFTAPQEVDAAVETKRGQTLGKVIYNGETVPDTGVPGSVKGYDTARVLRAPAAGKFKPQYDIGQLVQAGQTIGFVNEVPIVAAIDGIIRGMLFGGIEVKQGMKIGDIDPQGRITDYHVISDKARAIAGGVLEAIMHLQAQINGNFKF